MVHVDVPLTNIAVKFMQDSNEFIAGKIFPNVPVAKQSNKYFTFNRDAFARAQAERRSGAEESAGGGYQLSTDNYFCDQFSFHKDVPSDLLANTDAPLDAFRDATDFVARAMLLKQEADFVSTYFKTGVWTTDVTPGVLWSTYATSDPIEDVKAGKRAIQKASLFKPNTLVVGPEVHDKLIDHPDILDKMKYTAIPTPKATEAMLAQIFDVDRYLVGESVAATSVEGQTLTTGFQWGKNALLCYTPSSPSMLAPAAGYTFSWSAYGNGFGARISRFPMRELNNAERVEGDMAYDMKVVAPQCGYFFNGAVA